jgi:hypothetical protein
MLPLIPNLYLHLREKTSILSADVTLPFNATERASSIRSAAIRDLRQLGRQLCFRFILNPK